MRSPGTTSACCSRTGNGPREALPCYERAVAADPDLADAHYNLALLYEHGGRKQDAVRHFAIYKRLEHTS